MVVFPASFPHQYPVGQLVVHPPSKIVSHPKGNKLPCLLLAHPPSGNLLALGRGEIIPGFIRSRLTLAVYDVAHSLPLGGVGRGFPFTE